MCLKEFLKPTKAKIILTVIMTVILMFFLTALFQASYAPSIHLPYEECCQNASIEGVFCERITGATGLPIAEACAKNEAHQNALIVQGWTDLITMVLFSISASYLVSCILAAVYHKVKK